MAEAGLGMAKERFTFVPLLINVSFHLACFAVLVPLLFAV